MDPMEMDEFIEQWEDENLTTADWEELMMSDDWYDPALGY